MTTITNIQEYQALIDSLPQNQTNYLVLDFFATWCGPCKVMEPVFQKVSKEFQDNSNITFAKIDRDQATDLVEKFGFEIPSIPRFFVVKVDFGSHSILLDMEGAQSKNSLISKVKTELGITQELPKVEAFNSINNNPKVAVIGSGPSGLTAALYASRGNLSVKVFAGTQPGGQLTTTTEIENFPGAWSTDSQKGVLGTDLMATIQNQAEHFGTIVALESISKLEWEVVNSKPKFHLHTSESQVEEFDAVIIASGASAKYLGVEGESRWIGKGYHTCATCDGAFYKNKVVAIVGGGDSAMEEANFLTKHADKVYLINRTEKFRASKVMLERCQKNPKIEFLLNSTVDSFVITDDKFRGIKINNSKESGVSDLAIDGLFVAIGHKPNSDFATGSLAQDEIGYLIKSNSGEYPSGAIRQGSSSIVEGIFVAGDVQDTKYRQAITAAADGCKAAMDCEKWLESLV
jgi:thioredoxin reductase (NADPH)